MPEGCFKCFKCFKSILDLSLPHLSGTCAGEEGEAEAAHPSTGAISTFVLRDCQGRSTTRPFDFALYMSYHLISTCLCIAHNLFFCGCFHDSSISICLFVPEFKTRILRIKKYENLGRDLAQSNQSSQQYGVKPRRK